MKFWPEKDVQKVYETENKFTPAFKFGGGIWWNPSRKYYCQRLLVRGLKLFRGSSNWHTSLQTIGFCESCQNDYWFYTDKVTMLDQTIWLICWSSNYFAILEAKTEWDLNQDYIVSIVLILSKKDLTLYLKITKLVFML